MKQLSSSFGVRSRWLVVTCGCLWLMTVAIWLIDIAAGGAPRWLAQSIVGVSLLVSMVAIARQVTIVWAAGEQEGLGSAGRGLLLLTAAALIVHWIGVDWEITGRYYRDEGIYYAAANDINQGQLLPESFIYGHLPYYLYALVLWIQSLFPSAIGRAAETLFDVGNEVDVSWLLLRGFNTTLGALTTIPVFVIGLRIAGRAAAWVGSLLILFSPIYNEITRLIISDVPSAFFAAVSLMFVATLLDEERYRGYLWAGAAAALAAASKYPAGVVVVGIVGVWIAWRVVERQWSWHLVAAGAVSVLTFLLVMPAFWAHADAVFVGQGKDLLFGLRQYGRGGWIGVMPSSNAAWYGQQLLASFGAPVLILGLCGWPWLAPASRRRWLWMLPFPGIFLGLMFAMSMVVKRNLLPVVPAVAALLGVGMTGWIDLAGRGTSPRRVRWVAVVLAAALAVPIYRTSLETIAFARDSTREAAVAWIDAHVPQGAAIIKESYTPHVHKKKYTVHQTRFVPRMPLEEIRSGDWDYLFLARSAYGRFLEPENWSKPHHEFFAEVYQELLGLERVAAFEPTAIRMGPALELFAIDPPEVEFADHYRYAFQGEGFRYPRDDAFLLLKSYMAAGVYDLRLETEPAAVSGRLRVVTRDNRSLPETAVIDGAGKVELPWAAKYFFYTYLPEGCEIRSFELAPGD